MALTILNNIAAIAAENQLNITSGNLNSTLEQLSSGSRINSGADDPAGLAIANGLQANVAALTQSSSNATDGVGELQVADGALSQVTTLLDRAVTLATESATGTVSNPQRNALDAEYQSIKAEIDSIGSTTNYNGGQVFTANTLNVFLGDGSTTGSSQIGVATGTLSSAGLNLGGAVAATGTLAQQPGANPIQASDTLTGGTWAATDASVAASATITATAAPANGDTLTVGGQVYTFQTTLTAGNGNVWLGNNETAALSNLAAAINATAGGSGIAYGAGTTANTSVKSTASGATTVAVGALLNGTAGNNIAYSSTGTIAVTGADLTGGTAGTGVTVGGTAYQFVAVLSTTAVANEVVATSIASGLTNLKAAVNGSGGAGYSSITAQNANVTATTATPTTSLAFSAITPGAAGNFISTVGSAFGAWTTVNFAGGANAGAAPVAVAGNSVTVGTQTYNFVTALSTTPTANEVLVGVTEAASIANLANAINGGSGSGVTYGSPTTANTSATAVAGTNAAGTLSTLTLTALTKGLTGNAISTSEVGAANTFANSVLSGGTAGSVNDLLTAQDAQSALSLIDNAVATVAALRGNIGSTVNRLQSASNVINNQTQNLTSAENDVTAADIPTAVAKLSQYSILMQTGISALAQANQQSQLVLKLLQ